MTAVPAPHGQKGIQVKIDFFTDGFAPKDHIEPKQAWAGGVVSIKANKAHGIPGGINKPFNRMSEIPLAIEDVLEQAGVQFCIGKPSNKLYTSIEER